jgi:hypothetical protein
MQLYRNGGSFSKVNYWDVGVAGATGFATGFVAPVAAPGMLGAIGLGGISNIAQTGLSNMVNGRPTKPCEVLRSAGIGAASGLLGGAVGRAPAGRSNSDLIHSTGDAALDRAVNESGRVRAATGVEGLLRGLASGLFGNN